MTTLTGPPLLTDSAGEDEQMGQFWEIDLTSADFYSLGYMKGCTCYRSYKDITYYILQYKLGRNSFFYIGLI